MATFTDVTAYVIGVSIEASGRRSLLAALKPTVLAIRAERLDDTGFNYKRGQVVPEEVSAPPLRVACPRALADVYRIKQAGIEGALGVDRKITFKEFCKLAFLSFDLICEHDSNMMARIVKTWPPHFFGI